MKRNRESNMSATTGGTDTKMMNEDENKQGKQHVHSVSGAHTLAMKTDRKGDGTVSP